VSTSVNRYGGDDGEEERWSPTVDIVSDEDSIEFELVERGEEKLATTEGMT